MKKSSLFKKTIITLLPLSLGLGVFLGVNKNHAEKVEGYSTSSLPTTIYLNDTSDADIRSYYSLLNGKSESERKGNNLLKHLKTILKTDQKYYAYDGTSEGKKIWQIYEITDRDWDKSPASAITCGTYNANTNTITNYQYGTSYSSPGDNPYIHALYVNRNVTNEMRAWRYGSANENNHGGNKEWYIDREHIWPKSQGFDDSGSGGARGDPMHLWSGDSDVNSSIHNNNFYGFVDMSSSYSAGKYSYAKSNYSGTSLTLQSGDNVFEPQDCDKGDIARAIFYMVARYNYLSESDSVGIDQNNPNLELVQDNTILSSYTSNESTKGKMGILTDLLEWHHLDPVDEWEKHRNNLLYTNFTNNRNPFIDFPEWVDFIWGTATYNGRNYQSYSSTPTGAADPSSDTINGYNSGGSTVSVTGVSLNKGSTSISAGSTETLVATIAPSNASNQNVSWSTSNSNIATVSNGVVTAVSEGSATITVTTSDGGYTATCTVTVTSASADAGTESNPFTVAQARTAIDNSQLSNKYTKGIVYQVDEYSTKYNSITYWISDDGTNNNPLEVYSGKGIGGVNFSSIDDIQVGDEVVVKGTLKKYNSIYEYDYNNQLVSLLRLNSLSVNNPTTNFTVGDTFTFGGTATANYSDSSTKDVTANVTFSGYDMDTAGQQTVTVSYTDAYGLVTKQAQYTITVESSTPTPSPEVTSKIYKKITSMDGIEDGGKYIIAGYKSSGSKYYGMPTYSSGNNIKGVEISLNDDGTTLREENVSTATVYTLTSTGTTNQYYIGDGSQYLYAAGTSSGNNYLKGKAEQDSTAGAFTISCTDSSFSVVADASYSKIMRFNPSGTTPLFACYASDTQTEVMFFKEIDNPYTLVTDINDLRTGDDVLFVGKHSSNTSYYAASVITASSNDMNSVEINSPISDLVSQEAGVTSFRVVREGSNLRFKDQENGYLSTYGNSYRCKYESEESLTNSSLFSVSLGSAGLVSSMQGQNTSHSYRVFKFHAANTRERFCFYTTSDTNKVDFYFYKKLSHFEADEWSEIFLNSTSDGVKTCNVDEWSSLASSYSELSDDAKAEIVSVEAMASTNYSYRAQAMARYEYLLSNPNYNTGLTQFVEGRSVSLERLNLSQLSNFDTSDSTFIIIIVSLISTSGLVGCLLIKKRRKAHL